MKYGRARRMMDEIDPVMSLPSHRFQTTFGLIRRNTLKNQKVPGLTIMEIQNDMQLSIGKNSVLVRMSEFTFWH